MCRKTRVLLLICCHRAQPPKSTLAKRFPDTRSAHCTSNSRTSSLTGLAAQSIQLRQKQGAVDALKHIYSAREFSRNDAANGGGPAAADDDDDDKDGRRLRPAELLRKVEQVKWLNSEAKRLMQMHRPSQALLLLKRLTALTPEDGKVWMKLFNIHRRASRFAEAGGYLPRG